MAINCARLSHMTLHLSRSRTALSAFVLSAAPSISAAQSPTQRAEGSTFAHLVQREG